MNQIAQRLQHAREFLEELAEHPPLLPFEPSLMPLLFSATKNDSTASIADIASLVERSQKLASRVLAIANSACYALESQVTSLHRAVSVLGFNEVRSLVIMLGASAALHGPRNFAGFDAEGLWRHQLQVASLAKVLCATVRVSAPTASALKLEPDDAYAAGLLHDIGKSILVLRRPDVWKAIATLAHEEKLSFAQAETEYWGMDHSIVGAQVLHFWRLPLLLTESVNWHHAPTHAPDFQAEANLLAAADLLAHAGLQPDGALPPEIPALLPSGTDMSALATAVNRVLLSSKADVLAAVV